MRYVILLIIAMIFCADSLCAQYDNEESGGPVTLAPDLTRKRIGNFSVVTAEDAAVATDGKQTHIEDIYRYVGRKFKAVETRLKKLEDEQTDIKNRIRQIEGELTKIKKPNSSP